MSSHLKKTKNGWFSWDVFLSPLQLRSNNVLYGKPSTTKIDSKMLSIKKCLANDILIKLEKNSKQILKEKKIQQNRIRDEKRKLIRPMRKRKPDSINDIQILIPSKTSVEKVRKHMKSNLEKRKKVLKVEQKQSSVNKSSHEDESVDLKEETTESNEFIASDDSEETIIESNEFIASDDVEETTESNEFIASNDIEETNEPSQSNKYDDFEDSANDSNYKKTKGNLKTEPSHGKILQNNQQLSKTAEPDYLINTKSTKNYDVFYESEFADERGLQQLEEIESKGQSVDKVRTDAAYCASKWSYALFLKYFDDVIPQLCDNLCAISGQSIGESTWQSIKSSLISTSKSVMSKHFHFTKDKLKLKGLQLDGLFESDLRLFIDIILLGVTKSLDGSGGIQLKTNARFPRNLPQNLKDCNGHMYSNDSKLPNAISDYQLKYREYAFMMIETKRKISKESFAQLILQTLNNQAHCPCPKLSSFGVLTDGYQWVFLKLLGDKVHVESTMTTCNLRNGQIVKLHKIKDWNDLELLANYIHEICTQMIREIDKIYSSNTAD